jgi:hypothetical protein
LMLPQIAGAFDKFRRRLSHPLTAPHDDLPFHVGDPCLRHRNSRLPLSQHWERGLGGEGRYSTRTFTEPSEAFASR